MAGAALLLRNKYVQIGLILVGLAILWNYSRAQLKAAQARAVKAETQLASVTEGNETLRLAIVNKDKQIQNLKREREEKTRSSETIETFDPVTGKLLRREVREKEQVIKDLLARIDELEKTPEVHLPEPPTDIPARCDSKLGVVALLGSRLSGSGAGLTWAVGPTWETITFTPPLIPETRLSIGIAGGKDPAGEFVGYAVITARFR